MRRVVLLLSVALLSACEDALVPGDLEGRFGISHANGLPLPANVTYENRQVRVDHGFLHLDPDGDAELQTWFTEAGGGASFAFFGGTWELDGDDVLLNVDYDPVPPARLSDDGRTIQLSLRGVDFTYARWAQDPEVTLQQGVENYEGGQVVSGPGSITLYGFVDIDPGCRRELRPEVYGYDRRIEVRVIGDPVEPCQPQGEGQEYYLVTLSDLEAGPYVVNVAHYLGSNLASGGMEVVAVAGAGD
jgi:hypothetical protein